MLVFQYILDLCPCSFLYPFILKIEHSLVKLTRYLNLAIDVIYYSRIIINTISLYEITYVEEE